METSLNKNEKVLACIILGVTMGFVALFLQIHFRSNSSMSQIDSRLQVNYKMARPDEGYSEYSLNGREIDHTYEGLAKKEQAKSAAVGTAGKTAAGVNKIQTETQKKVTAEQKKVQQIQKAALARAHAQAYYARYTEAQAARQKALAKQQEEQKKTQADKNAAAESAAKAKSQSEAASDNHLMAETDSQQSNSATNPNAEDAKTKNKKTYAQWRAQIFAQPTRENVSAFLDAYRKNEISATEVQAMAQDLLDQNDDNLKGLGLYTLRSAPSLASLSQLVHAESQMNATYKAYIGQAFLAYLQPQNVGYLNQALQTKDKMLIAKTLSLLNTNLPNVAKGMGAFGDTRGSRDVSAGMGSNITMDSFVSLLPALSALASSQDQDYTALAQQVISYIQTNNSIARN